jgi:hypothetical protein
MHERALWNYHNVYNRDIIEISSWALLADIYDDHNHRQFVLFGFQYEFKINIDHAGGTVHEMVFKMVVLNMSVMIVITDVCDTPSMNLM